MKKRVLMLNYEFPTRTPILTQQTPILNPTSNKSSIKWKCSPLGGGASPVSYEIAKGYVKLGHKVDVVTMGFKDLPKFEKKDIKLTANF